MSAVDGPSDVDGPSEMMIDKRHSISGDESGNDEDARKKSLSPRHPVHQETVSAADSPSLRTSSPSASPATLTNASPVGDSSTRLSAIQTVLTTILPDLIQGEVRMQCAKLAEEIGAQIASIREEVIGAGDQDDPMILYKESENSRGGDKQSVRCSRDKGKEKDGYRRSQPNKRDETDDENQGDDDESDKEEMSAGSQKYKKQATALRVSTIHSCSP